MNPVKAALYQLCLKSVEERITNAQRAIEGAQAAANEETKSSSGDKYETGRAMAQLEIENNMNLLLESRKLLAALQRIDITHISKTVQPGALVTTSSACYFVSIGMGQMTHDGAIYLVISPEAPIAKKMMGLQAGQAFDFNGKQMAITAIA